MHFMKIWCGVTVSNKIGLFCGHLLTALAVCAFFCMLASSDIIIHHIPVCFFPGDHGDNGLPGPKGERGDKGEQGEPGTGKW